MPENLYPGVYVEELSNLPPSIHSLTMSVPVFIGYTEKNTLIENEDLLFIPKEINSLLEYEQFFGEPQPETKSISIEFTGSVAEASIDEQLRSKYLMHYSLQMFFANGGNRCFIVSVGNYKDENFIDINKLLQGLEIAETVEEAGLILFPDAVNIENETDYYFLFKEAIRQAALLKDRFVLVDVYENKENGNNWMSNIQHPDGFSGLRNLLNGSTDELKYAAAYFPFLFTNILFKYSEIELAENAIDYIKISNADAADLFSLQTINNLQYAEAKRALSQLRMVLPVTPAVAGVYAQLETNRGLWKAPANVDINRALYPKHIITDQEQLFLNIDEVSRKSINAIRKFSGRGNALIWGARTLAGDDNEWKYISTLQYISMLEKSIAKGLAALLSEPNEQTTWVKIKILIQNYLTAEWRMGAMSGAKTSEAFFVQVGLGETMTEQDLLENRMIVLCGVALLRPAEFIIFRLQLTSTSVS